MNDASDDPAGGAPDGAPGAAGAPADGDELARLTEERDFLLRSLDDLDREHAAGDLTDADYESLRDDYTARAAETMRAIGEHRQAAPPAARPRSRGRTVAAVVGVVAFAVVAGVVIAANSGSRNVGDTLTGSSGTLRDRLATCQQESFQKPASGITCYDAVLKGAPANTEALTYRGWAKFRSGDTTGAQADFDRVVELDSTYPDVYVFRAVARTKVKDWAGANAELDRFYASKPSAGAVSTLEQMGTASEVAYNLLDPSVQTCWQKAQTALAALSSTTTTGPATSTPAATGDDLVDVFRCIDDAAAARPTDVDPLLLRGFLLATSGTAALVAEAGPTLDRAVAVAPKNPTALLLRAAYRAENDDPSGALVDLDALDATGGRPSPLYPLATAAEIRAAAREAVAGGTTTTPATTTTTAPATR